MPVARPPGLTCPFAALALWLALPVALPEVASAGEPTAERRAAIELDEVLVTGERPGPAMWKVSKGDHTLWIMGTLEPLPAKMTWRSKEAERVIIASGEILADSSTNWSADLGFFEAIGLIRKALRLRHNADGATLRDKLPADVYARWRASHVQWFGKEPDAKDRARPSYAADLLYSQALKKSGLAERPEVWPKVERVAKQNKVKIRQRQFPVHVQDPKGIVAELAEFPIEKEVACLVATMDYIERELPDMKRRAQAWAIGDLATLRALPQDDLRTDCQDALLDDTRFGRLMRDEEARFRADWSGIVDWLLLTHATSFTTLPIERLLDEQGPLAGLRAKGYVVEVPP